jgi:hypothetical protein
VLRQREADVGVDRQRVEQRIVLEQHAHPLAQRQQLDRRGRRQVAAERPHLPAIGPHQPHHQLEQRGLARAAAPEDDGDLAGHDPQVEPAEHRAVAEAQPHVAQLDDRPRGVERPPRDPRQETVRARGPSVTVRGGLAARAAQR